MTDQPTIQTERLTLRPFTNDDAPETQRLAGDRDIASTTMLIPHPYPDGAAEEWLSTHQESFDNGTGVTFAITSNDGGSLIGAIGLGINSEHKHAEIGYWIGKPFWGNGYATEAAAAVLDYAFNTLDLNRIFAHHFARNPASGKVMQKIGMKREGFFPQHVRKWDAYEDIQHYGILRTDYNIRPQT